MGKASKATKKFSKNHLGDEIKGRKNKKNVKFREKKKWTSQKAKEDALKEGNDDSETEELKQVTKTKAKIGTGDAYEGNVDDFLEKGFFEALEDEDEDDEDAAGDESEEDEGSDEEDDDAEQDEDEDEDEDEEADPDQHKQDLERLKIEQPEFYKYLQENDENLLKFGESEEEEEEDEEEEDAEAGEEEGGGEVEGGEAEVGPRVLTTKMLNEWSKTLISANSYKSLRDLVRAFESACHLDDVEDMRGKDKAKKTAKRVKGGDAASQLKFRIVSGQVFERLMRMCVTKMHVYFGIYLQLKEHVDTNAPRKINPQLSARWKRVALVAKGYVKAMTNFVETLTDPSMVPHKKTHTHTHKHTHKHTHTHTHTHTH